MTKMNKRYIDVMTQFEKILIKRRFSNSQAIALLDIYKHMLVSRAADTIEMAIDREAIKSAKKRRTKTA